MSRSPSIPAWAGTTRSTARPARRRSRPRSNASRDRGGIRLEDHLEVVVTEDSIVDDIEDRRVAPRRRERRDLRVAVGSALDRTRWDSETPEREVQRGNLRVQDHARFAGRAQL